MKIHVILLSICLATVTSSQVQAASYNPTEDVSTDAGHIDFHIMNRIKHPGAYHQIKHLNVEDGIVELENGSRLSVSKADTVKGWDKSKNLVITQNHSGFSISRFALVNPDLKLAEPISLVREPTPKDAIYVKGVDLVNDIITLSDGKNWIVHASDRGKLNKFSENDRVIIGANTGTDRDKSPYLLIDTANNHFVRAQIIE